MKEVLITFPVAKLAKEKEFNIISKFGTESSLYNKEGRHTYYSNYGFMYSGLSEGYISAPTQSLLQKWLREVHNIHVEVLHRQGSHCISDKGFNTYEEALEKGLYQALLLLKVKNIKDNGI